MADNTKYGNAPEFDVDLHSIYAAYIGLFEGEGTDWWDKSWRGYFLTFGDFLGFGWEAMVIVDADTGRPHIAVRREQIALFARMIRTRFGESLPKDPPTSLPLRPVPTRTLALRRLITITDLAQYRKLALTLPAAELNHLRTRVRNAEVGVAEQLFYAGDNERRTAGVRDNGVGYTWACVNTTWWEKGGPPTGLVPGSGFTRAKGKGLVLEVGMAVMRCANLRAVGVWPPIPQENYRKSHFIIEEWVDKRQNMNPPSHPRSYSFGRSRYVAEKDIEKIVDATVSALAAQENDSQPNTLVLLTVGDPPPLPVPSTSTLPSNILHLDILALEYRLLRRAQEQGIPGTPDRQHPLPSLGALLQILQIPVPHYAPLGNAGNDAFYTVLAFQKLMMAETRLPDVLFTGPVNGMLGMNGMNGMNGINGMSSMNGMGGMMGMGGMNSMGSMGSMHNLHQFAPPAPAFARPANERRSSSQGYSSSPRSSRRMSTGEAALALPRAHTPDQPATPGSAPSTVRQPNVRAQTVFWDDSQYSPNSSDERRKSRMSSFDGHERGRPNPAKLPSSMSSRSVSWVADTAFEGSERPDRPERMGRKNRSTDSSPGHGHVPMASEVSLGGKDGSSSTKLSLESGSGSSAEGGKNKGGKQQGKLKTEKSVKNLAGSLARFWVG